VVHIGNAIEPWIYNCSFTYAADSTSTYSKVQRAIVLEQSNDAEVSFCSFVSTKRQELMAITLKEDYGTTNASQNWFGSESGPTSCCTESHGNPVQIVAGIDFSHWSLVR